MEEIKLSNSDDKGWLEKIKDIIYENWQTVLVALIVLIIGISAYNNSQNSELSNAEGIIAEEMNDEETIPENETEEAIIEQQDEEEAKIEDEKIVAEESGKVLSETTKEEATEVVEEKVSEETIEESGEGYEVKALKGEGVTHLARKALNKHLEKNQDESITGIHRIYIEDYLQNRKGNQSIEVGHVESFSESLIEEAISSSKKLSEKSLENLKKYSIR